MEDNKPSLTYQDAGVSIETGNALIDRIKPHAKRTKRPEVLGSIGGFGALMSLPSRYKDPVLVSGTDGVGTKLKLAIEMKKAGYQTLAQGQYPTTAWAVRPPQLVPKQP